MALFKCKMCGGNLEVQQNTSLGTCDSCGSTMTLPREADERKANLYNRANHYRRNNEFDKAQQAFENILNEDNSEAEAHWGVLLCKFGIEYIEDPQTGKRVPTCHRTHYESILVDGEYKQTLQYADPSAQAVYAEEAKLIDQIQKQILAVSSNEDPFDVFICYKETSETGQRTKDSVLAQEIYHSLTDAGLRVFFARVTLEDKLGSAYEPYIFAALNSAKAMVVVGTKPEYLNAIWTRNEWSRFLAFAKKDKTKVLIPAYRDMDPYDLPEEFGHLQALDMGKLGFMQDLTRGIVKITQNNNRSAKPATGSTLRDGAVNPTVASLLDRAFICLEDEDFDKADELLEQTLNLEPRNARAYLGKLMVEVRASRTSDLEKLAKPFDHSKTYQRAISLGDEDIASLLKNAIDAINLREEIAAKDKLLAGCERIMEGSWDRRQIELELEKLRSLGDFKNAQELIEKYEHKVDESEYRRFSTILQRGNAELEDLVRVKQGLISLGDYRDSKALLDVRPGGCILA